MKKEIQTGMLLFILTLCISCSGSNGPIIPDNGKQADNAPETVVLGIYDMTFTPTTRETDVAVCRNIMYETGGDLATFEDEVEITIELMEYDGSFAYIQGDPEDQGPIGQFNNGFESTNDGCIFLVTVNNQLGIGDEYTFYDARVVIEFDEASTDDLELDLFDTRPFAVINSDSYTSFLYGDDDADNHGDFTDYDPFLWLTETGEEAYPPDYSTHTLRELVEGQESHRLVRIRVEDGQYHPVNWKAYIIAEVNDHQDVPHKLTTAQEDDEQENAVMVAAPGCTYNFSVVVEEYDTATNSDVAIDEDDYEVYVDLSAEIWAGAELWEILKDENGNILTNSKYILTQSPMDGHIWQRVVEFNANQEYPEANVVLNIPIFVEGKSIGNEDDIDLADCYVLGFQGEGESLENGHYNMSFISRDEQTSRSDIFIMNTFSGEVRNLSNNSGDILYHSISEHGDAVAWQSVSDGSRVLAWTDEAGTYEVPKADENGAPNWTEISSDGDFIVWHETVPVVGGSETWLVGSENAETPDVGALILDRMDDIDQDGLSTALIGGWFPVVSAIFMTYPENLPVSMTDPAEEAIQGRLIMFPAVGEGADEEDEISRIGWVIAHYNEAGTAFETSRSYEPFSDLGDNPSTLAGQNEITRISIDPNYIVDFENQLTGSGGPGEVYGNTIPLFMHYTEWTCQYEFTVTFETDEDGFNRAFTTSFTMDSILIAVYNNNNELQLQYCFTVFLGEWANSSVILGPNHIMDPQHQYFADSARNDEGYILSVLRCGEDRDINTWLTFESPGGAVFRANLGQVFDLDEGEHDIPSISQGNFALNAMQAAGERHYPAAAFDSHHFSTGDIYLLQTQSVQFLPEFQVYVTLKRLTHNGSSIWPRLSGWIPTEAP